MKVRQADHSDTADQHKKSAGNNQHDGDPVYYYIHFLALSVSKYFEITTVPMKFRMA
jgi:hypothetical protein